MNSNELNKYAPKYFSFHVKLLKISGMWIPPDGKIYEKRFYLIYIIFVTLYAEIWYNTTEYIKLLFETSDNFEDIVTEVGMLISHALGSIKLFNYLHKMNKIQSMLYELENGHKIYECFNDFNPEAVLKKCQITTTRLSFVFFMYINWVPLSKIIIAAPKIILYQTTRNETLHCDGLLPYFSWFPFDINTYQTCNIAFIIQTIPMMFYAWQIACKLQDLFLRSINILALLITAHDIIFTSIMHFTKAHFIILQGAFISLRERCLNKLNIVDGREILHDEEVPELDREMMKEINQATKYLQILLRSVFRLAFR